jgi:hypothetical protein
MASMHPKNGRRATTRVNNIDCGRLLRVCMMLLTSTHPTHSLACVNQHKALMSRRFNTMTQFVSDTRWYGPWNEVSVKSFDSKFSMWGITLYSATGDWPTLFLGGARRLFGWLPLAEKPIRHNLFLEGISSCTAWCCLEHTDVKNLGLRWGQDGDNVLIPAK